MALEAQFEQLSLHRVSVGPQLPMERFGLTPEWSVDAIQHIRHFVKCACEAYIHSDWVCSHALSTLSLLWLLNISAALSRIPIRRAPGRPPALQHALVPEGDHVEYSNIRNFAKVFNRRLRHPLQWKVVDNFEVSTNGTTESSNFVGTVAAIRLSDRVYVWSARFDDEDMRGYNAEELAHAVRCAYDLGMNATG